MDGPARGARRQSENGRFPMISPSRAELTVTDNVPFGETGQRSLHALILEHPGWSEWHPGQFVMLRPKSWKQDMTWARPLSICRVTPQGLVLFFQVVGRGTERMARLRAGDKVIIWGPLGAGFAVEAHTPTLLLAGGIGIAPFAGYTDVHPEPARLSMLFGHTLPSTCYPTDVLARRIELEQFREQSAGDLSRFQDMVKKRMLACREQDGLALACGPMPFLRFIWRHALEIGLRTQLSLERRMACGVGACLGCVSVTSRHWADPDKAGLPVQTCTSGPVFWAEDLDLDASIAQGGAA